MKAALLCLVFGQVIELPGKVSGQPGEFLSIRAKTDGGAVSWYSVDPGLALFPTDLLKDTKTAVVISTKQGNYRLLAVTAKGDAVSKFAVCVVVIGQPGPDPGPLPPPGPEPGPEPTDTLWQPLKAAWFAEPTTTRIKDRESLALIYEEGIAYLRAGKFSKVVELNQVLGKAREAVIGARLPAIRAVLNTESARVLPTAVDAALDDATRQLAMMTFTRYVLLLRRLT